jgi:hypothetical protein
MILSNDFDVDKLVEANLDIDVVKIYLILTGSSLAEWLETANTVTGLYIFMSMANKSNCNSLQKVYKIAMMNLNSILQTRELPSRNTKRSGSKWTRDRNSKRMKRV